jgi:molecular chaperone GrpE (heat shock protein)
MPSEHPERYYEGGGLDQRAVYDAREADAYIESLRGEIAEWKERCTRMAEEAMEYKRRLEEMQCKST